MQLPGLRLSMNPLHPGLQRVSNLGRYSMLTGSSSARPCSKSPAAWKVREPHQARNCVIGHSWSMARKHRFNAIRVRPSWHNRVQYGSEQINQADECMHLIGIQAVVADIVIRCCVESRNTPAGGRHFIIPSTCFFVALHLRMACRRQGPRENGHRCHPFHS